MRKNSKRFLVGSRDSTPVTRIVLGLHCTGAEIRGVEGVSGRVEMTTGVALISDDEAQAGAFGTAAATARLFPAPSNVIGSMRNPTRFAVAAWLERASAGPALVDQDSSLALLLSRWRKPLPHSSRCAANFHRFAPPLAEDNDYRPFSPGPSTPGPPVSPFGVDHFANHLLRTEVVGFNRNANAPRLINRPGQILSGLFSLLILVFRLYSSAVDAAALAAPATAPTTKRCCWFIVPCWPTSQRTTRCGTTTTSEFAGLEGGWPLSPVVFSLVLERFLSGDLRDPVVGHFESDGGFLSEVLMTYVEPPQRLYAPVILSAQSRAHLDMDRDFDDSGLNLSSSNNMSRKQFLQPLVGASTSVRE